MASKTFEEIVRTFDDTRIRVCASVPMRRMRSPSSSTVTDEVVDSGSMIVVDI